MIDWWNCYAATARLDRRLLFAIPNGGLRNKAVAGKLKAEGVRAGVPDLMLALPCIGSSGHMLFAGMYIEMKTERGPVKDEQKQMIDVLRYAGYNVVICRGVDEALRAITVYVKTALLTARPGKGR